MGVQGEVECAIHRIGIPKLKRLPLNVELIQDSGGGRIPDFQPFFGGMIAYPEKQAQILGHRKIRF